MSIKRKIASLVPRELTLLIKYYYHKFYRFSHHKKMIETSFDLDVRAKKKCHTFFGYYDISPFNAQSDEMVYMRIPQQLGEAQILLSSIGDHSEKLLAKTHAWNWQQGSRLRWMPNNNREIVFNDFIDGEYIARIHNIDSDKERRINAALYDISHDGQWGLSIDFERLQTKRPGYGYLCRPYIENGDLLPEEGIDLVNLENQKKERVITYKQIAELPGCESSDFRNNYLNHLSFSPSGQKFLFFWLTEQSGPHLASLIVYDIKEKRFDVLETQERVSHYVWEDEDHIICTAYYGVQDCHYYRYTISKNSNELLCPDLLNEDGHPSIIKDNLIITDTYPDLKGFQRIYLVDLANNTKKELVSIYSDCRVEGERRTDLHPRLNSSKTFLCFDSNESKYRSMRLFSLG